MIALSMVCQFTATYVGLLALRLARSLAPGLVRSLALRLARSVAHFKIHDLAESLQKKSRSCSEGKVRATYTDFLKIRDLPFQFRRHRSKYWGIGGRYEHDHQAF